MGEEVTVLVEVAVGERVQVGESVIVGLLVMVGVLAGGAVGLLLEPQEVNQVVTDISKTAHNNR